MTGNQLLFPALIAGIAIGTILNIILNITGIQIGTKRIRAYIGIVFWFIIGTASTTLFVIYKSYFFLFISLFIIPFILYSASKITKTNKEEGVFSVRKKLIFTYSELVFFVVAGITITLIFVLRHQIIFSLIFALLCIFFSTIAVIKIKSIIKNKKQEER